MRRRKIAVATAAAALVAGLAVATSALQAAPAVPDQVKAATVKGTLKEWGLAVIPAKVTAGRVTFVVKNIGKKKHEFVVIKTNRAANALPIEGREASEKGAVDEIGEIGPGSTERLTLNLKKGKYVLICNLPGHYKRGQYAGLTVS